MGVPDGRNLRRARQQKNLRQLDLAKAVGVSQAAISMWESGRFDPGHLYRGRLLKVLGVDPFSAS